MAELESAKFLQFFYKKLSIYKY